MNFVWDIFLLVAIVVQFSYSNLPSTSKDSQESELVAVAVMFRHGDRAPLNSFPSDPYFKPRYWPMGFGQLTPGGIRRAYSLGKWFREQYGGFLNELYSPEEIYVWSTDVDRTLNTAQTVLAGLYPPKCFQIWNEDLLWQPIPVHTTERTKDEVYSYKVKCPKFDIILKKVRKNKFANIEREYQDLMNYVKEHAGFETVTLEEIQIVRNQIQVFDQYNDTFVPEWSKSINMDDLNYLADIPFQIFTETKTLARLRQGTFFYRLFYLFDRYAARCTGSNLGPKFFIFSSHDYVLVSTLDAMGIYDFRPIRFTETLIWELRKTRNCKFFVKMLYKHRTDEDSSLEVLKLENCDFECPYSRFKNLLSDITIQFDDFVKECHEEGSWTSLVSS